MNQIDKLIEEENKLREEKRKQEELRIQKEENESVKLCIYSNYKEFELKNFLDKIRPYIVEENEHIEQRMISFKVKNQIVAKVIKSEFREYTDSMTQKIYEMIDPTELFFNYPRVNIFEDKEDNIEKNIESTKDSEKYRSENLNALKEILSMDKEAYKNRFKKIMNELYELNEEQSSKFVESCFSTSLKLFKESPYIGSGGIYRFQFKNRFSEEKNEIYHENIELLCKVLGYNKDVYYRKYDDKYLETMLKDAKEASGIYHLKLRGLNFKEIKEEEYDDVDIKIHNVIKQFKWPKTEKFVTGNPFEFFNIYNMKERDYNEEIRIIKELSDLSSVLYIANYIEKIIDLGSKIKESSKSGKEYTEREMELMLFDIVNKKNIASKKNNKI